LFTWPATVSVPGSTVRVAMLDGAMATAFVADTLDRPAGVDAAVLVAGATLLDVVGAAAVVHGETPVGAAEDEPSMPVGLDADDADAVGTGVPYVLAAQLEI
jgi:hypothetical protein